MRSAKLITKFFPVIIFISLLLCPSIIMAQSFSICKSVDEEGHALNPSEEFTVSKDGGMVVFLYMITPENSPAAISYDIYQLHKGKEVFNSTLKQRVDPAKGWLSKEVTFYDSGTYRVYIYDDKDNLLAKSNFTIKTSGN